jgi:hypothetical protein
MLRVAGFPGLVISNWIAGLGERADGLIHCRPYVEI